jgi:hypothetical protein
MTITSALERLQLHPSLLQGRSLSRPVDTSVELATFLGTANRLTSDTRQASPLDARELDELRSRCGSSDYDLSKFNKREIRILLRDEATVLAPRFLANLNEAIRTSSLRLRIEPLITIYFDRWGSIPGQKELECLIKEALRAYTGCSPAILKYKGASTALFSPGADVFLAKEALRSRVGPASILNGWSIGSTTALGRAVVNAAVREYLTEVQIIEKKAYTPQALDALEFLTSNLLSSDLLDPKLLHSALSMIVLSQWTEKSDQFRRQVLHFILHDSRLGNPRFTRYFPNWTPIDPKVSQRVRSWLAREDIVFFFDFVLPDRQDKHRRKEFWLQYADQVKDSQVALCSDDRSRLRAQVSEQMAYTNISDTGVSAFLLLFEEDGGKHTKTVVAEFSQTGYAVYFYEATVFEQTVGSFQRRMFSAAALRHGDFLTKFNHYPPGQWQQNVRRYLAGRGVRLG